MSDIARLAIAVDTAGIKSARAEFEALAAAGKKVDAAIDSLEKSMGETTAALTQMNKQGGQSANVLSTLEGRGKAVTRSIEELKQASVSAAKAQDDLAKAQNSTATTASQLVAATEKAKSAQERLAKATGEAAKAAGLYDTEVTATNKAMFEQSTEAKILAAAQAKLAQTQQRVNELMGRAAVSGGATQAVMNRLSAAQTRLAEESEQVARATQWYNAQLEMLQTKSGSVTAGLNNISAALAQQGAAAQTAASGMRQVQMQQVDHVNQIKDQTGALRANSGNIAAQFQDIGVTAAMGMNPLMIGLQQGTQLSAVFAQSGRNMGETLRAAFALVLQPSALLVIGLVAAVAALVQMVNWSKLGYASLKVLADGLDFVADNASYFTMAAVALTGVLVILNRTAIITAATGLAQLAGAAALAALKVTILGAAFLLANPILFGIILVVGLLVSGFLAFGDRLGITAEGMDTVGGRAKWLANILINTVIAAVRVTGAFLVDIYKGVAFVVQGIFYAITSSITGMVNFAISQLNKLQAMRGGEPIQLLSSPTAPTAPKGLADVRGIIKSQYANDIVGGVAKFIGGAADSVRKASVPKPKDEKGTKAKSDRERATRPEADKFGDLVSATNAEINAIKAKIAAVDQSADAMLRLENQQKLLNDSSLKDITLTAGQTNQLKKLADELTNVQLLRRDQEAMRAIQKDNADNIANLEAETAMLGLVGDALLFAKNQQMLYNAAKASGMSDTDVAAVEAINNEARKLTTAQSDNARGSYMNDNKVAHEDTMRQLTLERGALGLSGLALAEYVAEQEALNAAKKAGIADGSVELEILKQRAILEARVGYQIGESRKELEFYKETSKGLFNDFFTNLRNGESFWDSFAKAAVNALNKIIDRMLDQTIEMFFSQMNGSSTSSSGKSGGGGFNFGDLIKIGAAIFGGGKAGGGPVSAGQFYRVNENGQEFFSPNVNGMMWNPQQMARAANSNNSGGDIYLTTQTVLDGQVLDERTQRIAMSAASSATGAAMGAVNTARKRRATYGVR